MTSLPLRASSILADSINDDASTRKVYLLAGGLALLGLLLIVVTVWFWRSTRHDPELLGPLEVLGEKRFRKLEDTERRRRLDASRPAEVAATDWRLQRGPGAEGAIVMAQGGTDGVIESFGEPAEPDEVRDAAIADAMAHSDLDSILAAAGAVVPGVPVVGAGAAGSTVDGDAAPTPDLDELGIVVAEPTDAADAAAPTRAASPSTNGDGAGRDADSPSAAAAPAGPRDKPAAAPRPGASGAPLLIVPLDHDLQGDLKRAEESDAPADRRDAAPKVVIAPLEPAIEDDASDAAPPEDGGAAIDPLLRMFQRNDG